jgi:hypothetical protein
VPLHVRFNVVDRFIASGPERAIATSWKGLMLTPTSPHSRRKLLASTIAAAALGLVLSTGAAHAEFICIIGQHRTYKAQTATGTFSHTLHEMLRDAGSAF